MNKEKFKEKLWEELKKIKFGETKTYSYIASKIGAKDKIRYVSSLLKENRFLISIPCHRVVKKNRETGNYVLGKEFKKYLLDWESRFFRREK